MAYARAGESAVVVRAGGRVKKTFWRKTRHGVTVICKCLSWAPARVGRTRFLVIDFVSEHPSGCNGVASLL